LEILEDVLTYISTRVAVPAFLIETYQHLAIPLQILSDSIATADFLKWR
jgi:hypothetical protein